MEFEVPRVPASIEPAAFEREFYLPRRPVIVEGVSTAWTAAKSWSPEGLRKRLNTDGSCQRAVWWWNVPESVMGKEIETPAIFAALSRTRRIITRPRPVRVWISGRGTVSPWHYDGNSLDGLNVQLRGRKRFLLLSPHTPLPCFPFLTEARASFRGRSALGRHSEHATCEIGSGDMLFLPRYWFHWVEALDDTNINVNWVWTDSDFASAPSVTADRERECVAVRSVFVRLANLMRLRSPGVPLADYGGAGTGEVARRLLRDTHAWSLLLRSLREVTACIPGAWALVRRRRLELELHGGVRRSAEDYFRREVPCAPDDSLQVDSEAIALGSASSRCRRPGIGRLVRAAFQRLGWSSREPGP